MMCYSSLESSHNDELNGGKIVFLRSLDAEILSETSKIGILYFTILRCLTFHLISRHPVIVERCAIARWNRLITASRMVVNHPSAITGCRDIKRNVKNRHFVFL